MRMHCRPQMPALPPDETRPPLESRAPPHRRNPLDHALQAPLRHRTDQVSHLGNLDAELAADALTRLDQASHVARGFPHDFLASADFIFGGMSDRLDLPPGRARHG